MVKTIEEFRDELRSLRREMFENAETADLKLVASWVDRLVMSLEGLSDALELMDEGVDAVSGADECCCSCCHPAPKKAAPAKKAVKKAAKKAKPAKGKKRR
ncbi:MAG: hypothetical protein V1861_03810 [Candidatus Micrarchaeota archaeon]